MRKILTILTLIVSISFANSLQEIQKSKTIKIGVRHALPPFSDQDENGVSNGFEVELAKAIGKKLVGEDGKVELVVIEAKDRMSFLEQNKLDLVIANMINTPERAKKVDFSTPYLSSYLSVLTRTDDKIEHLRQLNGKKLLYIKGTTTEDFIKLGRVKQAEWIECSGKLDCFDKLRNKTADGYVHINILIANLPLIDNTTELGIDKIPDQMGYACVGIQKNNNDLKDAVNAALYQLSQENFFVKQYKDYLNPFYRGTIAKSHLLLDDLYKMMLSGL